MDLREKAAWVQRASEYSIRFRLIEILFAVMLCIIALFNIEGVLVSIDPLSLQVQNVMKNVMEIFGQRNFHIIVEHYGVVFAILALFLFRWRFFGFKCGLLWFFFLIFNCLFLSVVGMYTGIMQIVLACIFIIAVTCFFFIRSMFGKSILPLILLAYSLSAWLLFLKISNLAWFGLVSLLFADTFHLIFVIGNQIRSDAKNKKSLTGAIVNAVRKTIPVSLFSVILLIVLDIVFYFMGLDTLASKYWWHSAIIYVCYVFWMPFFTAAVLSFCPLENSCEKILKKLK
jgi:hypothetical protein